MSQGEPGSDFRELMVLGQGSHGLRVKSPMVSRRDVCRGEIRLVKAQNVFGEGCRVQPASGTASGPPATVTDRPLVHSGSTRGMCVLQPWDSLWQVFLGDGGCPLCVIQEAGSSLPWCLASSS